MPMAATIIPKRVNNVDMTCKTRSTDSRVLDIVDRGQAALGMLRMG